MGAGMRRADSRNEQLTKKQARATKHSGHDPLPESCCEVNIVTVNSDRKGKAQMDVMQDSSEPDHVALQNPKAPSLASMVILAVITCAGLGCGSGTSPEDTGPKPEIRTAAISNVIHFMDYLDQARYSPPLERLQFESGDEHHYLTQGWNDFSTTGDGLSFATTRHENAVIEVPCVQKSDLAISLLASSAPYGSQTNRSLQVRWNGNDIILAPDESPAATSKYASRKPVTSEPARIEFTIPQNDVRVGPNRLELLSSGWEAEFVEDGGGRIQSGSLACYDLRIEPELPGVAIESKEIARKDENTWIQSPGSLASYYFPVNQEPRFAATLSFALPDDHELQADSASIVISAHGEQGLERELFSRNIRDMDSESDIMIDVDLSDFADQMVGFHFAFFMSAENATAADMQIELHWTDVRVEESRREPVGYTSMRDIGSRQYNVIMILFDTLRADFTDPYAIDSDETPSIARLAREGVVFSNAFSTCSWTGASIATILSSLDVHRHQFDTGLGKLSEEIPFLPEAFQNAGYHTVGIFGNPRLTPEWQTEGFYRGFDVANPNFNLSTGTSRPQGITSPVQHGNDVWDRFIAPAADKADDSPFFIFLHDFDPHSPFDPLPPYDEIYGTGTGRNLFATLSDGISQIDLINRGRMPLSSGHIAQMTAYYKGEIAYMDAYLGAILERLKKSGRDRDTLVVFLSDHGEEFMEHDMITHGYHLWDTLLRVPLIFSLPGVLPEGVRVERNISLVEVAPLILDFAGIEAPDGMKGSIPHTIFWDPEGMRDIVGAEFASLGKPLNPTHPRIDSVRYGEWKLIRSGPSDAAPYKMDYQLYHFSEDPFELFNLWAAEPVIGHALRQLLEYEYAIEAEGTRASVRSLIPGLANGVLDDPSLVSDEVRSQLEALGYLAP
jgi:arylsulfatase A-like enzyme